MKNSLGNLQHVFLIYGILFYAGVINFVTTIIFFPNNNIYEIASSSSGNIINQLSGLILLLTALFLLLHSPRTNVKKTLVNGFPLVALLAFVVMSALWAELPSITIRRAVSFLCLVIYASVLAQIYTTASLLEIIFKVIVFAVLAGLVFAVLTGQPLVFGLSDRDSAFKGLFFDKNEAARVYAYGLVLAFGLEKYKLKSGVFSIAVLLFALAISQSASAIVMAFAGCLIVILFNWMKQPSVHRNFNTLILVVGLSIVAYIALTFAYEYILTVLGRDPNLTDRSIIWELLSPLIMEKSVFGYGFGSFWLSPSAAAFIERWGFIGNAHNGYLEALLHGGVVLLGLVILILVWHIKNLLTLYIRPVSNKTEHILIAVAVIQIMANFVGYIILNHNSFDFFFFCLLFFAAAYDKSRVVRLYVRTREKVLN